MSMRRQGYKPNEVVAGREAWMRCCSEAKVCVKLHKFRLSCPPWTDTDKQLAGALLQSPLSILKRFKIYLQKGLVAILDHCMDALRKISKAGDAVPCSLHLQVPSEIPTAQKTLPGQNCSAHCGSQELERSGCCVSGIQCDDFHPKAVNLCSAASRHWCCVLVQCV